MPSDRRLALWSAATAPWWFWSDMPKLPIPTRNPELPPGGLAGDWVVRGLDRIATRVWIQRAMAIVVRGIWLTLLIGCLWLVLDLAGGPALDMRVLLGIGIFLLLCSLVVAAACRPTRAQVARMLDRSFGLRERITTALGNIGVDIPAEGERAAVTYLQVADAANAITVAQEHPAFRLRPPARELVMAVALGLAFAALAFARGAGGSVPAAESNVVPAFVPAAQRFVQPEPEAVPPDPQNAPSVAEVQKMVQSSIDNRKDLSALADALSDHAVTRDAAQLIDQGQYGDAAEALREVSNVADQLSESERQDLANDLANAASQMSDGNTSLSDATNDAGEGLQQGGDQAKDAVRNLANAVEQSGQQVQSSEELDQAMQQAQANEAANPQASTGSQDGNDGQISPNQDSSSGNDQQSAASGSQQSNAPGKTDAPNGADASGSTGEDSQTSSEQPGAGAEALSGSTESGGQQNQPSESSDSSSGNASGDSPQTSNQPAEGENANPSQGSGAGANSGDQDQQHNTGGSSPAGQAAPASETGKAPSDSSVSDASGSGSDTSGPTADPHDAVTLDRSPQNAQSVQVSSNSGAAQKGAGNGVTVSNGSATQGTVGQAGPDSNHVPPEYRSIVESYFSDKDSG